MSDPPTPDQSTSPGNQQDGFILSSIREAERIVIKVGSVLVTDEKRGCVRQAWLNSLAADIRALQAENKEIIIVTSGAIALGRPALKIEPAQISTGMDLELKQAAAALGQIELTRAYNDAFAQQNKRIAQILLSPADTENRRTHLNARATIKALLSQGITPVINENDTTATDEIRFGDNDRLAARVAQMVEADMLVILSTADGLYSDDPARNDTAYHIPYLDRIDGAHLDMAKNATNAVSTGGMRSKLMAARIAAQAGTHVLITSGVAQNPMQTLDPGQRRMTFIRAGDKPGNARKRWIMSHVKPAGDIVIDGGAVTALKAGKSLLPAGVISITGHFERGDAVQIRDAEHTLIAIGLSSYASVSAGKITGFKSEEIESILGYAGRPEIVHRDNLALIERQTQDMDEG